MSGPHPGSSAATAQHDESAVIAVLEAFKCAREWRDENPCDRDYSAPDRDENCAEPRSKDCRTARSFPIHRPRYFEAGRGRATSTPPEMSASDLCAGFGLKRGALGSTVAHDAHNVVVVGTNDADIVAAIEALKKLGGGQVAVAGGIEIASLPLPIAGLVSDKPLESVIQSVKELNAAAAKAWQQVGSTIHDACRF